MSKDPAVLFYTSDFISGTLTMNYEQKGKYIILLCLQHQQGRLSYEDMMTICGTYDEKIFSKFIKDDEGFYYNERMSVEVDKRKKYSESRSENRKSHNKHMNNICSSHEGHMENENENINVIKKENKNEMFNAFWKAYPKKKAKSDAEKAFDKLNPDGTLLQTILSVINKSKTTEDWLKEKGKFIPFPASWLNGKRWLDEETEHHPLAGKVSDKTIITVQNLENWRPQ